jgi:hypothetical protein
MRTATGKKIAKIAGTDESLTHSLFYEAESCPTRESVAHATAGRQEHWDRKMRRNISAPNLFAIPFGKHSAFRHAVRQSLIAATCLIQSKKR